MAEAVRRWSRADWMRRSDAARYASERAISGRRSSNPEGNPDGSDGTDVTESFRLNPAPWLAEDSVLALLAMFAWTVRLALARKALLEGVIPAIRQVPMLAARLCTRAMMSRHCSTSTSSKAATAGLRRHQR